jgi:hypothetical protein
MLSSRKTRGIVNKAFNSFTNTEARSLVLLGEVYSLGQISYNAENSRATVEP